jgi:hypothetical protein
MLDIVVIDFPVSAIYGASAFVLQSTGCRRCRCFRRPVLQPRDLLASNYLVRISGNPGPRKHRSKRIDEADVGKFEELHDLNE